MSYYSDEHKKVAAIVSELRRRNLRIPEKLLGGAKRFLKWPVSDGGYFFRKDGREYTPHDQQAGFVLSDSVFALFRGGRGSGKTAAGAQKALRKIMAGESGAVLNPDFENLKTSTWPELQEWIPWDLVIPRHQYRQATEYQPNQPFRLVFRNGAFMLVKGLKDPSSARGPNINWLWYDEAGRDKEGMSWLIALPSVRIGEQIQLWATTTPNFESPWIEEFFINKNIPQDALDLFEKLSAGRELVESFHGTIYDNEGNLNPVFMATVLSAYPEGYLRRQEIYGDFVKPEGSLGDRRWFEGMYLLSSFETVKKRIRFWDLAATEKKMIKGKEINDPDESVGTKMSVTKKGEFSLENQVSAFVEWDGLLRLIRDTSVNDGYDVRIFVEEEPGSGGKNQVAAIDSYLKEHIPGHPGCEGWRPPQDRVSLANVWFAEANQKKVFIVDDGSWDVEPFLKQLDNFPQGKHDDKITSVTGARFNVSPIKQWKTIDFMALGQTNTINQPKKRQILLL